MGCTDARWVLWLLVACSPEYRVVAPLQVDPAAVLPCPFEEVVAAPFLQRYTCNPVFSGTEEPWVGELVSVGFRAQRVLGAPVYQVWYSARTPPGYGPDWAIGHAVSDDGTSWVPHPDNPVVEAGEGWDADSADQLAVVRDADRDRYLLAYQGYRLQPVPEFGMGLLTSSDGVSFEAPLGDAPLVDLSETVDGIDYCWPLSLSYDGGSYTGWMAGHRPDQQVCQIYAFTTDDPVAGIDLADPTAQPEVVLGAGPEAYDKAGMSAAASVVSGGVHYLFYVGFATWEDAGGGLVSSQTHTLNLAVSIDGRDWRKYPGNPLPVNLTEEPVVSGVAAQAVGDRVHLWVTDQYDEVGGQAVGYYLFDPSALP